jgi:hypothetical protein
MMQSAQHWPAKNVPGSVNGAPCRREIHSAVGFAVTPNDTQSRRPWRTMTRQCRIRNPIVGRAKRSIAAMPST